MNTRCLPRRSPRLPSAQWSALLLVLAAAAASPAGAQGVWRCGGEGRVVYSDAPCRGGRAVDTGSPRSAADAAATWTELDRLQRWVGQGQRQRDGEQRRRAAAGPAALGPPRASVPTVNASASTSKKPRPSPPRRAHRLLPPEDARTSRAAATSSLRTTD